jgi:hypothetical protein
MARNHPVKGAGTIPFERSGQKPYPNIGVAHGHPDMKVWLHSL